MTKAQFLEFIGHFSVSRIGFFVPEAVLGACYDTWLQAGSLEPLVSYERAQGFLWDYQQFVRKGGYRYARGQYPTPVYDVEDLDWIQDFLEDLTFWSPADVFAPDEVSDIATHLAESRDRMEKASAYPVRRARSNSAINRPAIRRAIFQRDGYKCRGCGASEGLTVDHVIAVINGGGDSPANLQTLCRPCNSSKGAKDQALWKRTQRTLGRTPA